MSAHTSYVCCIWTIVLCLWSHFFKNWFLKGNIQYLIFKLKYSYIYIFFNHTKKTQFGCVHSSPPHFVCHFLSDFCFLWDVAHVLVAFFQDRIKCCCRCYATLLTTRNTSTLVTSSHGLRLNIWLNCSLLESFLPQTALCMKLVTADYKGSTGVFLFAVLYILEKESKDFASCVFPSGLFVVHDSSWGGQHNVSEETWVGTLTYNSN